MQISRSGYYVWRNCIKSLKKIENERLIPIVQAAHKASKGTYGARRIAEEIKANGSPCGRCKAGTLMKLAGVAAKQKKKFKATTNSKHKLPVALTWERSIFRVTVSDSDFATESSGSKSQVREWAINSHVGGVDFCWSGSKRNLRLSPKIIYQILNSLSSLPSKNIAKKKAAIVAKKSTTASAKKESKKGSKKESKEEKPNGK